MIETTLGMVLSNKVKAEQCRIYLVRDDEVVFYIGQSRHVVQRVKHHLLTEISPLGAYIRANRAIASDWVVQFYIVDELASLIQSFREIQMQRIFDFSERCGLDTAYYRNIGCRSLLDAPLSVDEAERALIHLHSPCLNKQYNFTPTALPAKRDILLEGEICEHRP